MNYDDTPYDDLPKEWQEAIDHNAFQIKNYIDSMILWTVLYNDDMKRELSEQEQSERFVRVNGDQLCCFCDEPYIFHPYETRILSYEGQPFLHRLCDGRFGKL